MCTQHPSEPIQCAWTILIRTRRFESPPARLPRPAAERAPVTPLCAPHLARRDRSEPSTSPYCSRVATPHPATAGGSLLSRRARCGTHKWRAWRTSCRNRGRRAENRVAQAARGGSRLAAIATRRMRHTQVARPAHIYSGIVLNLSTII
jgi:hypothetical protein